MADSEDLRKEIYKETFCLSVDILQPQSSRQDTPSYFRVGDKGEFAE
jgi:hypothetical protein